MKHLLGIFVLVYLATGISAFAEQKVAVIVMSDRSSWIDSRLQQHLEQFTDEIQGLQIASPDDAFSSTITAELPFDQQRLCDLGNEWGIRYLLWCEIREEKLKLEKGFSFPFLFTQQRVCAELALNGRLIDCIERKSIWSEEIVRKCYGASALQILEQTSADDDLHLTYSERVDLFDRLEQETARAVGAKLAKVVDDR